MTIKLTKSELRTQQLRLSQLEKYLPTLKLKKALLQAEVNLAREEIGELEDRFVQVRHVVVQFSALLSDVNSIDINEVAKVTEIHKRYENVAGVEVPYFEGITFAEYPYNLFATPPWVDSAITGLRSLAEARAIIDVAEEKKRALEKELREVSIRVNLFEKILIPRTLDNIKTIRVFLGDQLLAAVSQAKVAKNKRIVLVARRQEAYAH